MTRKTVIFDFDGTIADTFPTVIKIINRLSKEYNYNEVSDDDMDDLRNKRAPELVMKKPELIPLRFAHKSEGVAVINKNRIVIIHDDDYVMGRKIIENPETQFSRLAHQAAYTIVEFGR